MSCYYFISLTEVRSKGRANCFAFAGCAQISACLPLRAALPQRKYSVDSVPP